MKRVSDSTKQSAIELRKQGKTYQEISQELTLSLDWCKRNLKDVLSEEKERFQKLYQKGKSTRGVSRTEVFSELELGSKKDKEQQKLMNSAVKRIRSNNKDNIVRPDWMIPSLARFCTDSIVSLSMDIEERCHEEAYRLYSILSNSDLNEPVPSVMKIKSVILGLAMAAVNPNKGSKNKLSNWLESLYVSANKLEQRSLRTEVKAIKTQTRELPDDLDFLCY